MANRKIDPTIEQLKLEIKNLKHKLTQSNQTFVNIVGKNKDAMLLVDRQGIITYANQAAVELFGLDLGSLLGENIGIFIGKRKVREISIHRKDGSILTAEVTVADTCWYNKPAKLACLRDVTEQKKARRLLEYLSHYDYLTQLTNRVYFEQILQKSLARARRSQQKVALLFLDLNKFKEINDTYGHYAGDKLLIQIAERLKQCLREADTASRLGGDEFTIILEGLGEKNEVEPIAKRIIETISEPISIDGHILSINASIGIAVFPKDGETIEELIRNADKAMYLVKKRHSGGYHIL
jgi:diguanylate cyclase (GGDEF)-like protein